MEPRVKNLKVILEFEDGTVSVADQKIDLLTNFAHVKNMLSIVAVTMVELLLSNKKKEKGNA